MGVSGGIGFVRRLSPIDPAPQSRGVVESGGMGRPCSSLHLPGAQSSRRSDSAGRRRSPLVRFVTGR